MMTQVSIGGDVLENEGVYIWYVLARIRFL